MKTFLQKYKKNILQILGFIFGFLVFKKMIFLYLAIVFLFIVFLFPNLAKKINIFLDKIINTIGNAIKTIILIIIFIAVVFPISVLNRIIKKKNNSKEKNTSYFIVNKEFNKNDMKNMW